MTRSKLLLADDSVTIKKVVELTFVDEGIDVSCAADAQSAMQKFIEVQPDIVLVDVSLTGISGYQICEMIKADETTSHIPVLLLVGSFEPFDHAEAERVGADGFLTKPFRSIRDLVSRVTELLGEEGGKLSEETVDDTEFVVPEPDAEVELAEPAPFAAEAVHEQAVHTEPDRWPETEPQSEAAGEAAAEVESPAEAEPVAEQAPAIQEELEATEAGPATEAEAVAEAEPQPEPDTQPARPPSLTSDIEELYSSSFAVTAEIEEFDTLEDPLGDSGLDDELIETTYPSEPIGSELMEDDDQIETAAFDWSPESIVTEPVTATHEDVPVETTPDTDLSVAATTEDISVAAPSEDIPVTTPDEDIRVAVPSEDMSVAAPGEDMSLDASGEDISVGATTEDMSFAELNEEISFDAPSEDISAEPASEFEETATSDEPPEDVVSELLAEEAPAKAVAENGQQQPSPELIAMITERVLERLSDSVVREIARDAVPRIAEKLIREALDPDRK